MMDEKARHEMKKGYIAQLGRLESRIAVLTAILKRLPNICACPEHYVPGVQCVYCAARAALNEKTDG
jgi:hypothetical protein